MFSGIPLILESLRIMNTLNGKCQIQVENFSKIDYEQIKKAQNRIKKRIMDKKLHETTNLCVEIMNSTQQVKRKLGHVVQIRGCH